MNVSKGILLAATSATLLLAAPLAAQVVVPVYPPPSVPSAPVHAPKYDLGFEFHANNILDRMVITKGTPGFPVVLMFGVTPLEATLPNGATLRLDPLVFLEVGKFDASGKLVIPLVQGKARPEVKFYMQAVSIVTDYTKFCTSELIHVRTTLKDWWFERMG